jgi:hypothetical protein
MMKGLGMYDTVNLSRHRWARCGLARFVNVVRWNGCRARPVSAGAPPGAGDRHDSKRTLPMGRRRTAWHSTAVFLLAPLILVHCLAWTSPALPQGAKEKPGSTKKRQQARPAAEVKAGEVKYAIEGLPTQVQEMRNAILGAVRSGRIDDLRYAWELNELKPDLGGEPVADPIAHFKQLSGDGEGREILAALGEILESGYVVLPLGRDLENNRVFVWPYFAEVPLDKLSPAQEVELYRLVPPAAVNAMRASGRYTYWRVAIGADGTWHSFRREP